MSSTMNDRIDGVTTSVAVKAPCRVAALTNISLYGEQTINGVSCVAGDRVLAIGQTDKTENGIYDVSSTTWQRAADFDGARDVRKGTVVLVNEGSGGGRAFSVSSDDPNYVGTSDIEFESAPTFSGDEVGISVVDYTTVRLLSSPLVSAKFICVEGRSSNSDGGQGVFIYDPADTTTPDNGGTVLVDASGRRLKRLILSDIQLKWFVEQGGDAGPALNSIFSSFTGVLDVGGLSFYSSVDLTIPADSGITELRLSGGSLSIRTGVFNIERDTFTISLDGGEISLGLKKAVVASDVSAGSTIPVASASEFSVGDVVSCSFDLFKLPNDTSRSTLPGTVLNTVASIASNTITMAHAFNPTTEASKIPAGAYITNAVFTKPGIYFTGSGRFRVKEGQIKDSCAGYFISVINASAVFESIGVDYSGQGLDAFQFDCKDIIFDGFSFGAAYDIAKQAVVAKWTGLFSMQNGRFKRSNSDAEIYVNSSDQMGDLYLANVEADGLYTGIISSGSLYGQNSLNPIVVAAQDGKLGNVTLDAVKFKNYRRPSFGSAYQNVTSFTMKSFTAINCTSEQNLLYTQFASAATVVSCDSVNVIGGKIAVQTDKRINAGYRNVYYQGTYFTPATTNARYSYCTLDGCHFAGGAHLFDNGTVTFGRNFIRTGGAVALQENSISSNAVFVILDFDPASTTGSYLPITTWLDSTTPYAPRVKVEVPGFSNNVIFGYGSAKYTIHSYRDTATTPPTNQGSKYGVLFPLQSKLEGVGDSSLHKCTNLSSCSLATNQASGATSFDLAGYTMAPAIGDILGINYANNIVKFHRVTAVAGATVTISPGLYEAVTTAQFAGLNRFTAIY